MTTMTAVAAPAGEWTLAYTAAADITITTHNPSQAVPMRTRIGAGALVGDALTAASLILNCGDERARALKNGDKVFVAPVGTDAGSVVIWA